MSAPAMRQPDLLPISEFDQTTAPRGGSALGGSAALAMASLEAVCTFFVALSKLGMLVAFTSFLSTVIVSRYHADVIRIPVLGVAFVVAALNMVVLWNRRRARNLPSAAWRRRPLTAYQRWRERLLVTASGLTIVLVVAEFWIHPIHRF
jgi:hypothetical protein